MWKRDTTGKCSKVDMDTVTITAVSSRSIVTIVGLEEDSSYAITVTATSVTGNTVNFLDTAITTEAGEVLNNIKRH